MLADGNICQVRILDLFILLLRVREVYDQTDGKRSSLPPIVFVLSHLLYQAESIE